MADFCETMMKQLADLNDQFLLQRLDWTQQTEDKTLGQPATEQVNRLNKMEESDDPMAGAQQHSEVEAAFRSTSTSGAGSSLLQQLANSCRGGASEAIAPLTMSSPNPFQKQPQPQQASHFQYPSLEHKLTPVVQFNQVMNISQIQPKQVQLPSD